MQPFGPAVGIFEFSSLARGYAMMDLAVKKAPVHVLEGTFLSPGKFFLLFNGDEASVDESFRLISETAKKEILDSVLIPQIHEQVLPGLYSLLKTKVSESLGVVEVASMSSGLLAADQTLKSANVSLIEIRSSRGIGGKCFYFFTGRLEEVQAGVDSSVEILKNRGTLIHTEIIANPHVDFLQYFNPMGDA